MARSFKIAKKILLAYVAHAGPAMGYFATSWALLLALVLDCNLQQCVQTLPTSYLVPLPDRLGAPLEIFLEGKNITFSKCFFIRVSSIIMFNTLSQWVLVHKT
jgi:hypothetical protein